MSFHPADKIFAGKRQASLIVSPEAMGIFTERACGEKKIASTDRFFQLTLF